MERRIYWHGLVLAFVLLTLVGCGDDPDPVKRKDVYWVGLTPVAGKPNSAATYWKNGNPVYVTDGTAGVSATGIAFSGSSVYVLGKAPYGDKYVPSYWKDGALHQVTTSTANIHVHAIGVNGNDVYVAGQEYDWLEEEWIPRYWKNGQLVGLTGPSARVSDIVVSNGAVYAAGRQRGANSYYVAMYWKDGVAYPLTDGTNIAEADAIGVTKNGDVYVAGYEMEKYGVYTPKYWKNGEEVTINENAYLYDIAVSENGDVYLAGETYGDGNVTKAAYWKNGTMVPLDNDGAKSRAYSITFDGFDAYILGYTMTLGNVTEKSIIWKNNTILHEYDKTTSLVSLQSH